MVKKEPRQL